MSRKMIKEVVKEVEVTRVIRGKDFEVTRYYRELSSETGARW